jgi:hypothetical protein
LRAVTVVDVPIDDRDARCACRAGRRRCRRDVVEQAKAHRTIVRRVMAGWPHDGDALQELALHHAQRELARRASGGERGVPCPGRVIGVSIEPALLARYDALELSQQRDGMDGRELVIGRLTRRDVRTARSNVCFDERITHRFSARGPLWMSRR